MVVNANDGVELTEVIWRAFIVAIVGRYPDFRSLWIQRRFLFEARLKRALISLNKMVSMAME